MKTVSINVDAELARQYIQQHHQSVAKSITTVMDEKSFLKAFVHDRLRKEIAFLTKELNAEGGV